MPGRSDDEILSDGYTVGDYRKDSEKTAQIETIISQMQSLDKNSSSYLSDLNTLYNQGLQIIGSMYGIRMTNNAQNELDNAYSALKDKGTYSNETLIPETSKETEPPQETTVPETEPSVIVVPNETDTPESPSETETAESDSYVTVQ